MQLNVIKHDRLVILNLTTKKRLLNLFIFSNDSIECEVKFVKPRDRLNFLPSVGIEPTSTWLKDDLAVYISFSYGIELY